MTTSIRKLTASEELAQLREANARQANRIKELEARKNTGGKSEARLMPMGDGPDRGETGKKGLIFLTGKGKGESVYPSQFAAMVANVTNLATALLTASDADLMGLSYGKGDGFTIVGKGDDAKIVVCDRYSVETRRAVLAEQQAIAARVLDALGKLPDATPAPGHGIDWQV